MIDSNKDFHKKVYEKPRYRIVEPKRIEKITTTISSSSKKTNTPK